MANQIDDYENFSAKELMICTAAREIKNNEVVFVGIGLPLLVAMLAQRTNAPDAVMAYESGIIGSNPTRLALSIADPALVSGSLMTTNFFDFFTMFVQNGNIDVGFVGGAQIDKFGNLNSIMIGDYKNPKKRFPGGGGAYDMTMSKRTIVIMPHEIRRFVEKVDFITTPGHLINGSSRSNLNIPGNGPDVVITTLGVMKFNDGELYLASYHDGVSIDDIKDNTGWDLKISNNLKKTIPPTVSELKVLRSLKE